MIFEFLKEYFYVTLLIPPSREEVSNLTLSQKFILHFTLSIFHSSFNFHSTFFILNSTFNLPNFTPSTKNGAFTTI